MTTTLAVTLLVAAMYLLGVRLIDFNEKEPLWAVLLLFGCGLAAAVLMLVAANVAGAAFVELDPIAGALSTELLRFFGIGAGIAVLVGRWSASGATRRSTG